jgi:2'-5' RNA ligase
MHRLFVALRPPPAVRDVLLDAMEGVLGARWQDEDQLHLTLRFAGELETPQAEDLADALALLAVQPFELAVRGAGHFERKGAPHTLWAGVAPNEALAVLQRRVERACRSAGLKPETRKFAPHITLARLNRSSGPIGGWLTAHSRLAAGPWRVESFGLYLSRLTPAGSEYERVESYPLG